MKKKCFALIALVLALSMLLQGCIMLDRIDQILESNSESTRPTVDRGSYIPYEQFPRLETAYMEEVSFDELEYERPDVDALIEKINELEAMVGTADADELIELDSKLTEEHCYIYTMGQYAYIRYTLDLNDTFYDEEYNWCEQQSPLIEQAWESCYTAMAKSDLRDELEKEYYGEGFFLYYDDNPIYTNERVVELMQLESELQSKYMALQSDMTIEWNGEETLVDELINDPELDYYSYITVWELYYEKYNPQMAEIFIDLIRVRKEIAEELDYDSYADFAYEFYFERDYTPEQVEQYTDDIAMELAPLYESFAYTSYTADMDIDETESLLEGLAYDLGGEFATAYDYMRAFKLCDFTESTSKMPGSYMTYLSSYGMPFMYVSPTGTIDDFLTATHEFGHFVDGYVNCNYNTSIDCAEIFSQGLEFLALNVADLSNSQRTKLEKSKVADALMVFLSQASYAEFEQRAYELPDSELTAENLNALFGECCEKFGMSIYALEDIIAQGWIDVQHFFIAPMYVISYCVSNDVALQIYQIELESGDGMDTYLDLLYSAPQSTILALLEEADMVSPFDSGRMKTLAKFFESYGD